MTKLSIQISLLVLFAVLFTACANTTLKAPCDHEASFCGTKTKINRW